MLPGFFKQSKAKTMTEEQLETEARQIFRMVFTESFVSCNDSLRAKYDAEKAFEMYKYYFQRHVTETPAEPVSNKLPEFVPEWGILVYDYCAQDANGDVWSYSAHPEKGSFSWGFTSGDCFMIGKFKKPENWETAIWKRPE